jgi:murein DD-endopeptidase MepM/ murein hydrolase activator NlpD
MKKYVFYMIVAIFWPSYAAPAMVGPFYVDKPYGGPAPYGEGIHPGIDFGISSGTPIIAVSDGEVIKKDPAADGIENGIEVVLLHKNHFVTIYAHLSKVFVQKGQLLKRGQLIGLSGASNNYGKKNNQHLHFGICKLGSGDSGGCRKMTNAIDPKMLWLGGQPQCFDQNMDYSSYSQKDITIPVACGDYGKALIAESKRKD